MEFLAWLGCLGAAGVGAVMRRPAWLPVPAPAIRLLLGEMAQLVLTGQHVVPTRLQALGFTLSIPTSRPH
jgi:uncharacterized protein